MKTEYLRMRRRLRHMFPKRCLPKVASEQVPDGGAPVEIPAKTRINGGILSEKIPSCCHLKRLRLKT